MIPIGPRLPAPRPRAWLAPLLIAAAVALVFWPGLHGDWGRDDYFQLALVRLLGSPWPLFTHDAFPVPGSVFRPLGFASMWLDTALFGTDYQAHALVDLALHGAVALALFDVLRRSRIATALAVGCTLLFALHPAALGTALWWSARFDLLATLFALLAVDGALAFRERASMPVLAVALLALLAAMLSKETGLAAVVPVSWVWLRAAARDRGRRASLLRAASFAWLVVAAYFAWRRAVLGTASSALTGSLPVATAIGKGVLDWLRQMPGYLSFGARLQAWQVGALLGAALLAAMAALAGRARPPDASRRTDFRRTDLAVCGLCLFVLPALLQAPVAALNAASLTASASAIETAMQSRLYYLGLGGVAMLVAAALAGAWNSQGRRRMAALAFAFVLPALAAASHHAADAFARRSAGIAAVARAAVAAVSTLDLPAQHCHVVFLGVDPAPEWDRFVSMDSIVKALAPDLRPVAHCWFHADYPTWFHLLAAPVAAADARPWLPAAPQGVPLPWRQVGNLVVAYVEPLPAASAGPLQVLRWRDGRFVEIPAQAGREDGPPWQ